jgi:hypothetical protein
MDTAIAARIAWSGEGTWAEACASASNAVKYYAWVGNGAAHNIRWLK